MGLVDIIRNLDGATKTRLIGDSIAEILRFTFIENEYDVVDEEILNKALALQKGEALVKKEKKLLLEFCRLSKISSLGFDNHDQAIEFYEKNHEKFIKDFDIEEKYLLQPLKDERENFEVLIPKYGKCNGIQAFPHDYQYRLKTLISNRLFNGINPVILASMPTGAGKTVLGMEIIVDLFRSYKAFRSKNINILWIVHRKELSEQSLSSFQKIWKQKGDHPVVAERFFGRFSFIFEGEQSKITFATFDLLSARKNSKEVQVLLERTDFLFIDEAHSSDANTYRDVIQLYKNRNSRYKILGLTATPHRSEDTEFKTLKDLFSDYITIRDKNDIPVESPLEYLIDRQFLARINFEILDVNEGNIGASEFYRSLHKAVLKQCRDILKKSQNTIIFAKTKAHAIALSLFLLQNGVENGLIVGETSDPQREKILKDFGDKERSLSVIVNHQILSTGIDVPGMNSIMILADVESPTLALQILGRAMRGPKNGGNIENTIYLTPSNQKKLRDFKILESIVLTK